MPSEHNEHRKALAALHALERHALAVLDPGVFSHVGRSVEALPTGEAGVGPFSSVSPHVFFDMTLQLVSLTTNGTGVWFLVCVRYHVGDRFTPVVAGRW